MSGRQVDGIDRANETLHALEQPAHRVDNRALFKVGCRNLGQHRGEQEIVVTRDQCHLKVIVSGQQFFQSKRCVHTAETTAEDEYTLGLRSGGRRSRFFHIALASYAEIGPGLTYYDAAALRRVS